MHGTAVVMPIHLKWKYSLHLSHIHSILGRYTQCTTITSLWYFYLYGGKGKGLSSCPSKQWPKIKMLLHLLAGSLTLQQPCTVGKCYAQQPTVQTSCILCLLLLRFMFTFFRFPQSYVVLCTVHFSRLGYIYSHPFLLTHLTREVSS